MANNRGELCIIMSSQEELVKLPEEIPSQYLCLTGYQLHFTTPANAKTAGGLVYFQIDDFLSFGNVYDTNPTFTSIPLTYTHQDTAVDNCFQTDGFMRYYKINRKLPKEFVVRAYNAAKTLIPTGHIVRIILYFSIEESKVFKG